MLPKILYCDFCERPKEHAGPLFKGTGSDNRVVRKGEKLVYICRNCIERCSEYMSVNGSVSSPIGDSIVDSKIGRAHV